MGPDTDLENGLLREQIDLSLQEEIEALFVSVRDVILARPDSDIADLAALLSSPRRRRMRELQLEDLSELLQVVAYAHALAHTYDGTSAV